MLSQLIWQALGDVFGAEKLALEDIYLMQGNTPNLITYALPFVALFTCLEFFLGKVTKHHDYHPSELKGSLLVGAGNLLVNLLLKSALLFAAVWLYNLLPWRMHFSWLSLIPCFIIYDFCSYWSHRISHFNRFFWASHVVHHSAEHYNLTVAFRQSWVQHIKIVFFIPVALCGFHPIIFLVASQISTLYQFWVHTETIGKLHPVIEKYFGTPSNHRVHHGSQDKYIDKNFGATFMVWDHLFNTFQYEEEKPKYGLTTPVENKANPFVLNFHEYRAIAKDLRQSDGLGEMLFFLFASPAKVYKYKTGKRQQRERSPKITLLLKASILGLLLLLMVQLLAAQPTLPSPKLKNLLFFLQRTPDANTVVYQLNLTNGGLDSKQPIKAFWVRYEENGLIKELSAIEKKFAYGVKCRQMGNGAYEVRLVSYKKLPMYLLKPAADQPYRLYIKEEEKYLLLKRVFVKVQGGSYWFPKVHYIDLFTVDSENGAEILKRIKVHGHD
jgi:sterol desaturase/sphingolipid hydroxylase (fatty acid hydroxylase superfamily)